MIRCAWVTTLRRWLANGMRTGVPTPTIQIRSGSAAGRTRTRRSASRWSTGVVVVDAGRSRCSAAPDRFGAQPASAGGILPIAATQERLPAAVDVRFGGAGIHHHSQTGLVTPLPGSFTEPEGGTRAGRRNPPQLRHVMLGMRRISDTRVAAPTWRWSDEADGCHGYAVVTPG